MEQAEILQCLEEGVFNPPNHIDEDWEELVDRIMLKFMVSLVKYSDFKPGLSAIIYRIQ
jgi:hypothetical protein